MWALSLWLAALAPKSAPEIDSSAAADAFAEFQSLCTAANTELWGEELCGPLMLVSRNGYIVTNRPAEGLDEIAAGLYAGTLPKDVPAANTAVEWSGVRWTQMLWPLPDNERERLVLMAHEAFHRIQPAIGMRTAEGDNSHLDDYQARLWLWLRLEARALERALEDTRSWKEAARDALLFRSLRTLAFSDAAANECALIFNEGLAEYTGARAGAGPEANHVATARLTSGMQRPSFVRTIGYAVGPAYGLLLDRTGEDWRNEARAGACPPDLLQQRIGTAAGGSGRAELYGFAEIDAEERQRDDTRREVLARLSRNFIDGPVLLVPFSDQMRINFSPNRVTAFAPHGTVYTGAIVRDVWGRAEVEGDLLMSPDRTRMRLPGPVSMADGTASGPGRELTFQPTHELQPGARDGDLVLVEVGR